MQTVCFKVAGCIDGDVDRFWHDWVNFEAFLYGATDMRSARREAAKLVNRLTCKGKLHLKYVRIIRVLE